MDCQVRPVTVYIITRYFGEYGEPLTRVRLNLLLALAIFTRGGEVDIHEIAPCFGYRIVGNPIMSPVLDKVLGELSSMGIVRVFYGLIRPGQNWPSNTILLDNSLIGRISEVLNKYGGLEFNELRRVVRVVFGITPSLMGSGYDLVDYLRTVIEARRVGAGIPSSRLYVSEL